MRVQLLCLLIAPLSCAACSNAHYYDLPPDNRARLTRVHQHPGGAAGLKRRVTSKVRKRATDADMSAAPASAGLPKPGAIKTDAIGSEFKTPNVGTPEWEKEQKFNEKRERELNNRIQKGICRC